MFGAAALNRFGWVEATEVLADDLLGAIALDALGSGIPTGNLAAGVEQDDSVVANVFHQQAKALIT